MLTHVTDQNFTAEVLDYQGKVLVDFWAPWCGPCQMLSPVIEEIASEVQDVKVVKVNVDENPDLANQYHVSSIPNVMIFDHGQVQKTIIGFHPKQDYLEVLLYKPL